MRAELKIVVLGVLTVALTGSACFAGADHLRARAAKESKTLPALELDLKINAAKDGGREAAQLMGVVPPKSISLDLLIARTGRALSDTPEYASKKFALGSFPSTPSFVFQDTQSDEMTVICSWEDADSPLQFQLSNNQKLLANIIEQMRQAGLSHDAPFEHKGRLVVEFAKKDGGVSEEKYAAIKASLGALVDDLKNGRSGLIDEKLRSARVKYDPATKRALPFDGISVIHDITDRDTLATLRWRKNQFEQLIRAKGLSDNFAFVDPDSYHITTFDLVCVEDVKVDGKRAPEQYARTYARTRKAAAAFMQAEPALRADAYVAGLSMFEPTVLKLDVRVDDELVPEFDFFRDRLNTALKNAFFREKLHSFSPHITFAYLVKPLQNEKQLSDYMDVLREFNDYFAPIGIGLSKGELMRFSDMDHFYKDDATRIKVAVVGGTGNIGLPIVNRLKASGAVEVLIGSRKADPARGILTNQDAVSQADVVIYTVPAAVFTKTVEDTVPLMNDNTVVVAMVVPMGKGTDGKLAHQPAQGFASAAEEMEALIRKNAGGKKIRVVAGMHNIPGECIGDPMYALSHDVVVMGDDEQACRLVGDNVVRNIGRLNPVIAGGLSASRYSEKLTSLIIRSKKELLQGRSLFDLFKYVAAREGNVSLGEIMFYNREILDPELKTMYLENGPARLNADLDRLATDSSVRRREYLAVRLTRLAQLVPDMPKLKTKIDAALSAYKVSLADAKVYNGAASAGDSFISKLAMVKTNKAAIVVTAETVFRNGGVIASLRNLKDSALDIERVVWAGSEAEAVKLRSMGVDRLADIQVKPLSAIVDMLAVKDVDARRIVVIATGSAAETRELIKSEPTVRAVTVAAPRAKEAPAINVMPLAVAKAVTLAVQDENVNTRFGMVAETYKGKISDEELAQLEDLEADVSAIPLVTVDAELAKAQVAYEDTIGKL